MFVGVFFRTSNHTPFCLFICVKLIISVHVCFTAVVRHKPSQIVVVVVVRMSPPTWRCVANRHPFCDLIRIGYIGHHDLEASWVL